MASLYQFMGAAQGTTAATVKKTTGNTVLTLLQVLNANADIAVVEWGISFDGSAAATPIECELIHTTTVAATVTAHVENDITKFGYARGLTAANAGFTLTTSGCGYTSTSEGSIVAPVRTGDIQLIAPTNQYVKQFPLGREFVVPAAGVLRVRVTAAAAVNAYCYIIAEV